MAKYTIMLSAGAKTVFDAANLEAAKKYAESKGWNPSNVSPGDWITYPTSGYPSTTPITKNTAIEESIAEKYGKQEEAKWSGKPTPQSALLTPEEKEYLSATYQAPPKTTTATTPTGATGGYSQEWLDNYNDYLAFIKTSAGKNFPTPKNINDYILHYEEWMGNSPYYQAGYSQDQIDSYAAFQLYQSKYGDLNDYLPSDLTDYLSNYDKAQQQLTAWKQEAGPEATGFTDAQIKEFNDYKQWYYQYGKPGDEMPADIGDFISNYDTYQQQLSVWQGEATEAEKYELTPGEAARRREEAYAEERYAAQERYTAAPSYFEPFTGWLEEQGRFSGALQEYIEKQYPSLQAEFEAGLPELTGYPTREEARAEKARRESSFQAWLPEQVPELYQEYMGQRPSERGERLYMQAPTTRTINW